MSNYSQIEFNKYKNNLINQLTYNYNYQIALLNKKLNIDLINISKTNLIQSKKNIAINLIINSYKISLQNLKNNYNLQLNNINKMTMPSNINNVNNRNNLSFCIGINYIGSSYQLNGCINDAINMKDFLEKNRFKNIGIMTDNLSSNSLNFSSILPTKINILNYIKKLLNEAQDGTKIFLSFSGHGSYATDQNGDELTGYDQMFIPCDFNPILDDDIKQIINNNLKTNVTLIALFDSCFSGSVLDLKFNYNDTTFGNNTINSEYVGEFTQNNGETETTGNVILISGCSDYQTSADAIINNIEQGALTWAFIQSFNQNQNLTWRQLLFSMRQLLITKGFKQVPQLSTGKFMNIDDKIFFL